MRGSAYETGREACGDRRRNEVQIVENQRPVHGDRDGLIAAIEFPSIDALTAVTEVDAAVAQ